MRKTQGVDSQLTQVARPVMQSSVASRAMDPGFKQCVSYLIWGQSKPDSYALELCVGITRVFDPVDGLGTQSRS